MVFPFALAIGVGIAFGIVGLPLLWMLAAAAACAGLYMWNTRNGADGLRKPSLGRNVLNYLGLLALMSLVGGAGYLLGDFFGWARLDA